MILPGGQDKDSASVKFQTGADGSHRDRLNSVRRTRAQAAKLIEDAEVRHSQLGQQTRLVHHGDSFLGVVTLGGFSRQHDTVGTIQDSVGDIGHLRTSRARVIRHGLQHLRGADHRLTLDVALGDHHLLGEEDLGGRNLNTEITTSDHDTVGLLQNLVKVVDTLLVLDLGNDLDFLAFLTQNLTNVTDVAAATDERGKNHVDLVLDTKLQVVDILLGQSREVNIGAWQVDTLSRGDVAIVETTHAQGLLIDNLEHGKGQDAVIDIDEFAGLDHLGNVLVVDVPTEQDLGSDKLDTADCSGIYRHVLVIAGICIFLIRRDVELVPLLDGNVLVAHRVTGTDLGTFLRSQVNTRSTTQATTQQNLRCRERWPEDGQAGPSRLP